MTAPRRILPGQFHLLTRRCTQRQFLLRPDPETNELFRYCLAVAANACEIGIIGWVAMSNHYHAVVYDPYGRVPEFLQRLNLSLAKVFNAKWGRMENLWSSSEAGVAWLPSFDEVLDKLVYVLANPSSADLVDSLIHWPGSSSLFHLDGHVTVHHRPRLVFAADGRMPEVVELRTIVPPGIDMTQAEWAARVRRELETREKDRAEHRRTHGISIVGRKRILRASHTDSPDTPSPRGKLNPALACRDEAQRQQLLKELIAYYIAYDAARRRFIAGERDAEFPAGTYQFRLLGARCAPFPTAA